MEWILTSDRLPEDLEQVLITYTNTRPEPYYKDILGKNFTGAGYYYDGHWYWWSDVTDDLLKEYGRMPFNPYLMDEAIKVLAWQPFPKPLKE